MISVALIAVLPTTTGFIGTTHRLQKSTLSMCDYQTQVLAAQPTIEEWLDVADPGLKKATLAMFRSVKEIAYKIRTASCDKMSCFNDFGKGFSISNVVFVIGSLRPIMNNLRKVTTCEVYCSSSTQHLKSLHRHISQLNRTT